MQALPIGVTQCLRRKGVVNKRRGEKKMKTYEWYYLKSILPSRSFQVPCEEVLQICSAWECLMFGVIYEINGYMLTKSGNKWWNWN